jgi:hypothetical protein
MKDAVSERFRAESRKPRAKPECQRGGAKNEGEDESMGGHRVLSGVNNGDRLSLP